MEIPKDFFRNLTEGEVIKRTVFSQPPENKAVIRDASDNSFTPLNNREANPMGFISKNSDLLSFKVPDAPVVILTDLNGAAGSEKIIMAKNNLSVGQPMENIINVEKENYLETDENTIPENIGQLVVDVYQSGDDIIIKSTIAGVEPENLDVQITVDTVTIKGKRMKDEAVGDADYFCQECYWGSFARTIILPDEIEPEKTKAVLKNGVLTLKLPKAKKHLIKKVKVEGQYN